MQINNDLKLFFIRHGKLDLPYKNHDKIPFDTLADLGLEKLNPSLDEKFNIKLISKLMDIMPLNKINKIYTSPSKRCLGGARLFVKFIKAKFDIDNIPIVINNDLREVYFDLRLINEQQNLTKNPADVSIEKINQAVLRAMVTGKGSESVGGAYKRISDFARLFKSDNINKDAYLIITHDFLMRVMEVYIKNKKPIVDKISYNDLKDTKRNLYFKGFATDISFIKFIPF